jgi:hypothetical protein
MLSMSPTVRKQVSTTQTPANIHEVLRWSSFLFPTCWHISNSATAFCWAF